MSRGARWSYTKGPKRRRSARGPIHNMYEIKAATLRATTAHPSSEFARLKKLKAARARTREAQKQEAREWLARKPRRPW